MKEEKQKDRDKKEIKKLKEKIKELELNLEEEKEKSLRSKAEMLNFKKRILEEQNHTLKYANTNLIEEILSIVDNFERAIILDDNDLTDELSKFLSGFKMIYGNLMNILNNEEVKEIEASGTEFDPNLHQAVITEKDENKPEGVVLEVLQKGYKYKDKVIRPAMVKVNE